MALSTLLRSSMCMNRVLSTQALRFTSRPAPLVKLVAHNIGVTSPILNAVRAFRTSSVNCSAAGGDHTKVWVLERIVSILMVPLIPAAILSPSKALDSILAVLIVAHTFWGFEAIAVDYVRPVLFGPVVPKLAVGLVYLMSFATLGGLFYLIQHDIGLANSIKQLWSIQGKKN